MGFNLTNEYIDQTFQQLTQISGSVLVNGTGSAINNLTVTSSFATTASYALNGHVSASYAQFATSASHADNANTASFALNFNPAATASYALFATSASHAVRADGSGTAEDLIITVKNVSTSTIAAGVPVYANGVTGENVNVLTASNDSSATMPAIGVTQNAINASGNGIVVINGRESGIDTSGLVAGQPVYVGLNGALTATRPTGSLLIQNIGTAAKIDATDGEIILQGAGRTNDLPNITTDYIWKGDANGVPQAVASSSIIPTTANTASYVAGANVDGTVASATSASFATNSNTSTSASHAVQADSALSSTTSTSASHAVNADTASFLPATTRLNITDITASNASFTSASIGYLTSITGSAKVIGDAFIILNNDTPTQRYAGLSVYDSGSANTTASLWWDGGTNDWKYQYSSSATHEAAILLTGPEMTEISGAVYPTANTILKGQGGHHVGDSNITDNGSLVTFNSDTTFTGSMNVTSSLTMNGAFRNNISQQPGSSNQFDILTAPAFTKTQNPGSGSSVVYNNLSYGNWGFGQENAWLIEQGNAAFTEYAQMALGIGRLQNIMNAGNGSTQAVMDLVNVNNISQSATEVRSYGSYMALGEFNGKQIQIGNSNRNIADVRANQNIAIMGQDIYLGGTQDTSYTFRESTVNFAGNTPTKDIKLDYTGSVYLRQSGSIAGTPALIVTGSVTATSFTGSLLGSDIVVSGSVVSEINALSIASNTASMDCQTGDMFTLTLVSGSNTHLNATNVQRGQTISLKVLQPSTATNSYGTMTFESEFAFAGGTPPTITAASGSTDILTFQSYDATTLFGTAVQNLS